MAGLKEGQGGCKTVITQRRVGYKSERGVLNNGSKTGIKQIIATPRSSCSCVTGGWGVLCSGCRFLQSATQFSKSCDNTRKLQHRHQISAKNQLRNKHYRIIIDNVKEFTYIIQCSWVLLYRVFVRYLKKPQEYDSRLEKSIQHHKV